MSGPTPTTEAPPSPGGARRLNERAYWAAVVSFTAAVIGGVVAASAYWTDHAETLLGVGLGVALFGIGFGLVSWAKYLDLDEHAVQHREVLEASESDRDDVHEALTAPIRGAALPPDRRRVLTILLGGSFASMAIGFIGPVGSLGPKPAGERDRTGWVRGRRLVTSEGQPIDAVTGVFDQLATVFPDGMVGRDDSQVVLLRIRPELLTDETVAHGAVDGWVAYSKICTHAGCSVGLFGIDDRAPRQVRQLVCPCHQSAFDPADGARPIGGPAPRPLPQLALMVDDEGYLAAAAEFAGPIGPIAWDEG